MKSNNKITIIIGLVIALLVATAIVNPSKKDSYENIKVYKNNSEIIITEEDKNKIVDYLKKEKLAKTNDETTSEITYTIEFDNKELSFGEESKKCFIKDNSTFENYNTTISDEFRSYIIDLAK